jgi:hypothetical protein
MREKAKWQYEKSERDDELQLNNMIKEIEKHGNIHLKKPEDDLIFAFNKMEVCDNIVDDEMFDDIDEEDMMMDVPEKLIDNPFAKYACPQPAVRGARSSLYAAHTNTPSQFR